MLPFMKPRHDAEVIVKTRMPDDTQDKEESGELSEIEESVKDAKEAWQSNDMRRFAQAVKIIHDILHDYMDKPEDKEDNG